MEREELIKKCEETMLQLKKAEETLAVCDGICESYFRYGYHNEGNNIRYNTIKRAVESYFKDKGEKDEFNRNKGVQSQSK